MAAAKKGGGGGGGVKQGPRGGRYIEHGGNKHYLKPGESPSAAAVRVGAPVSAQGRGKALAAKAAAKYNAQREKRLAAGKSVAPPLKGWGGKKDESNAAFKKKNDQLTAKAVAGQDAAAKKERDNYQHKKDNDHATAKAVAEQDAAAKKERDAYNAKATKPKFDAMADAEKHIAKLKAESAAKNAAKAPAAIGGYGGPPPSGEATNKKAAQGGGAKAKGGKDPHAERWAAGKSVPTSYGMEQLAKEAGTKVQHIKQSVTVKASDHPLVKAGRASALAEKTGKPSDHVKAAEEHNQAWMAAMSEAKQAKGATREGLRKLADKLAASRDKHYEAAGQ